MVSAFEKADQIATIFFMLMLGMFDRQTIDQTRAQYASTHETPECDYSLVINRLFEHRTDQENTLTTY